MENHFEICMTEDQLRGISSIGLAHMGDAVFELLVRRQAEALRDTGRVDFGGGVLKKLAEAFCDSPYIQPCDWADTLAQLTELFYALKNETRDQLGDDTLIAAMAARFNGDAGGSLDALAETDPAWFLRFTGERSTHEPWPDPPASRPFP